MWIPDSYRYQQKSGLNAS